MAAPTAASTPPPGSVSPPLAVPPAPPEADRAEAEDAAAPPLSPMAMRQALDRWKASPDEGRSRRAPAIGRAANRFVASHPAAPLSREIETSLPGYLKRQATASLDHAQPVPAHLYFRAYQQLQFAPPDAELESRFGGSPGLAATPRARPPATPAGTDGR